MNLCRACGEDFSSIGAFDKHRVGGHAYTWSLNHPDGRRCLIGDELLEAEMELDPRGRWRIALTDSERSRIAGLRGPVSKRVRAGHDASA
jgi:hypothetical protein